MRHALVLAGGGAYAAYQVGGAPQLLEYYAHTDSPITIISGTSAGALNAAALVQGATGSSHAERARNAGNFLIRTWLSITPSSIIREHRLGKLAVAWRVLRGQSLYDAEPLAKLLECVLDVEAIAQSPWKLLVHAVDVDRRQQVTASNRSPRLREAVLASASIPVAFPAVRVGALTLVDGGVVANAPIAAAIKAGAERVTVISMDHEPLAPRTLLSEALSHPGPGRTWTPLALGFRAVETMMAAHLERDLRMVELTNDLIRHGGAGDRRLIQVRILHPTEPLGPPGSTLDFRPEFIRELIQRGANDAERFTRGNNIRHR